MVAARAVGVYAAGRACLQPCLHMLGTRDKSMADCAQAVHEMIPVSEATATLARAGSEHLSAMAGVCHAVCEDCKGACAPHVNTHAECKACHDACTKMLAALDGLA